MCVILAIWLLSAVCVLPQVFIQRLRMFMKHNDDKTQIVKGDAARCGEYFSDHNRHDWELAYTLYLFLALFLLPLIVMCYAYGRLIHTLRHRKVIGEGARMGEAKKEQENIVKMLVSIVLCFTLCWLPYFGCQIFIVYANTSALSVDLSVAAALFQLLGYSNACFNPFIYCFLNKTFRLVVWKQCGYASRGDEVRWKVSFTSRKSVNSTKETSMHRMTSVTVSQKDSLSAHV